MKLKHTAIFTAVLSAALFTAAAADACTRLVFEGDKGNVLTARSMDWSQPMLSNLWIFPQGMHRAGAHRENGLKWVSRYGSVITSGEDVSTTDGVNEKGLAAHLLWLSESGYPKDDGTRPVLSVSAWVQYILDNFATVPEAVDALRKEAFIVVTDVQPGADRLVKLHLAMSDSAGNSAVAEYINGRLVIHDSPDTRVVTNSPVFDELAATARYWDATDGYFTLPGTTRSVDRFVRARFYTSHIPVTLSEHDALTAVFSVIRNTSSPYRVSKPLSIKTDGKPGPDTRSSTRWRSVVDHKQQRYYLDAVAGLSTYWVDLNDVDFSAQSGTVRKLELGFNQQNRFSGNVTPLFRETAPFDFMSISQAIRLHSPEE